MGTLYEDLCPFITESHWILFIMRNGSDKSCREHQNTHIIFQNIFPKTLPLWDNEEVYGTAT